MVKETTKNSCEKMKFHKWLNVSKIKNSWQILLWPKLRKCRKWHFFLHDLRKNTIFVLWKCLIIKGGISWFFARVRKGENYISICEKTRTRNILDLRALWKTTSTKSSSCYFPKGAFAKFWKISARISTTSTCKKCKTLYEIQCAEIESVVEACR